MRAAQFPDSSVMMGGFLDQFGRPQRQSACECERTSNFTLSHAINLVNGATIGDAVSSPSSRIPKIVTDNKDDRKVIEELYYSILNRPPSDKELEGITLGEGPKRLETAQDIAWALLNSPAFLYNR